MARITGIDIKRFDYPSAWRIQILQVGCAAVDSGEADRRGRRTGLGSIGAGRNLDLRDRRERRDRRCGIILRRPFSAPIRSDLADVHARMDRAIRPSFSVGQPLCKAAIDLACYDLWGKQTRQSGQRSSRRCAQDANQAQLDDPVADAGRSRKAVGAGQGARLRQLQHQDRLCRRRRQYDLRACPHGRDVRARAAFTGATPIPATISTPR